MILHFQFFLLLFNPYQELGLPVLIIMPLILGLL
uniref:Uncharacterized protein n=1 Tax=virus sp. ctkyY8 TaxID=2827995 RepID=A0A8S5REG8_9VIRU|nr:MAG TPA: hypothetical protein [virus sp. ctkyY8]